MGAISDLISGLISAPFLCIGYLIIGFLAGALARRIMGSQNAGCGSDILLGIIGAIVGGVILRWLGIGQSLDIGFGIGTLITALIGAIVLIGIGRIISPRRTARR